MGEDTKDKNYRSVRSDYFLQKQRDEQKLRYSIVFDTILNLVTIGLLVALIVKIL